MGKESNYILVLFFVIIILSCTKNDSFLNVENVSLRTSDFLYVDSIGSYLSSYQFEGRLPGSVGDSLAMEIISNEFVKYGLKPLYGSSYYWKFPVNKVITYNIIGMKLGIDSIYKDSIIIVCAHHDHLGKDENGNVYYGASDNASGTACMLLLARKLKNKNFKRTIVFIATGAEEGNLYGMRAFKKSGLIHEKNMNFMFNFDNLGRLNDFIYVCGKNNNDKLKGIITKNNSFDLPVIFIDDDWFRKGAASDNAVYNTALFPAIAINTGYFAEHHTIHDSWDKINVNGIVKIHDLFFDVIVELLNE